MARFCKAKWTGYFDIQCAFATRCVLWCFTLPAFFLSSSAADGMLLACWTSSLLLCVEPYTWGDVIMSMSTTWPFAISVLFLFFEFLWLGRVPLFAWILLICLKSSPACPLLQRNQCVVCAMHAAFHLREPRCNQCPVQPLSCVAKPNAWSAVVRIHVNLVLQSAFYPWSTW